MPMPLGFGFRLIASVALCWAVCAGVANANVQDTPEAQNQRWEFQRQGYLNVKTPLTDRIRLAQRAAAEWDAIARKETSASRRRFFWDRAAGILEEFNVVNSKHPQIRVFQAQAGIYRWAIADTWVWEARLDPENPRPRQEAVADLDALIVLWRELYQETANNRDLLAQNVRYRLARSLADRADQRIGPGENPLKERQDALTALNYAFTEPSLLGFVGLLRAQLLIALGKGADALAECDRLAAVKPAASATELLQCRVEALLLLQRLDDARRLLDAAKPAKSPTTTTTAATATPSANPVEESVRLWLLVRVLLKMLDPGGGKLRAVTDPRWGALAEAFRELKAKFGGSSYARLSLLELGRVLTKPDAALPADLLRAAAEGGLITGGNPKIAADLFNMAANQTARTDRRAAAQDRLAAAGVLVRAGLYPQAEILFTQLWNDPQADPVVQSRAGLLRCLARGQAIAVGDPSASLPRYTAALNEQIAKFPKDDSAMEARWLLGKITLAQGDRTLAESLWKSIPTNHPRWFDSRQALIDAFQKDLDELVRFGTHEELVKSAQQLRDTLDELFAQAQTESLRAQVDLKRVRLDLTPGLERADTARLTCELMRNRIVREEIRREAQLLLIVAMAQLNRFRDAEELTSRYVAGSSIAQQLDIFRLLDQSIAVTRVDQSRRRIGQILIQAANPVASQPAPAQAQAQVNTNVRASGSDADADVTLQQWSEARMRLIRGQLYAGEYANARRALATFHPDAGSWDDALLSDLAETCVIAEDYKRAVVYQRLRTTRSPKGSKRWIDARHGLAYALYRDKQSLEARKIVDATAILYPGLGGGAIKQRFQQLQRILGTLGP